jgi:hypothetical protein
MDQPTLPNDLQVQARDLWTRSARAQGLVCQICHEPPSYDERDQFFDTGVCIGCATDAAMASPLTV